MVLKQKSIASISERKCTQGERIYLLSTNPVWKCVVFTCVCRSGWTNVIGSACDYTRNFQMKNWYKSGCRVSYGLFNSWTVFTERDRTCIVYDAFARINFLAVRRSRIRVLYIYIYNISMCVFVYVYVYYRIADRPLLERERRRLWNCPGEQKNGS